jgi:hypothetical protein
MGLAQLEWPKELGKSMLRETKSAIAGSILTHVLHTLPVMQKGM